ncbi:MAG TPA: Hpt domain-containing protein, partial [bacterium]|nr:Hpt domain-containing protein [bacterium]
MQNFEVDKEIFEEFISDASEQLYRLDNIISHLNVENIDMQALNEFMRVMHSLKGNSGFVGLMNLSQLAHKLEDLVVDIQNNRIYVNEEIIDIVFTGLGSCRDIIERASLILEQNQLLDKEQELIERIKKLKDKPQSVNSKQLEGELEKTLNYIRELDKNNVVIVEEELKDLMIKVQTINSFLNKYTEQKIEIAEQRQNIEQAKRYYLGFTDITASLKEMFELIEKAKQDGGGDDIYYAVELIFTKFKQIIETENVYKDKEELMLIIDMIFNEMKLLKSEFSELVCTFIEEFDAQIVKFLKYPLVIDESETVYIDKYFQKVKEGSIEYAKIKELMAIEKEVLAQLEQEETVKKTEPSKKSEIQETVKEEQKKVEDRFIRVAQDRVDNFMMNVGTLIIKSDSLHYFYKVLNNNKILEKKEIQNYRDTIIELTDMIYKLQ